MGYDQHDQTIYVPYNQHEKEFHYYIGACNNSNYEKYMLTMGTLFIKLPCVKDTNGNAAGFLFDSLIIDADQLSKYGSVYSVEFGGLSNDIQYGEYVGYNYGLKKEETLVIAGINENLDGVNDSISNYMQGGKLVITKAQMEAKQGKKLDSVRYIRIRFQNVKGNAASNADFATKQAEGIKIRVCGTTNVYADYEDNSGLYSEAAFIRPE